MMDEKTQLKVAMAKARRAAARAYEMGDGETGWAWVSCAVSLYAQWREVS